MSRFCSPQRSCGKVMFLHLSVSHSCVIKFHAGSELVQIKYSRQEQTLQINANEMLETFFVIVITTQNNKLNTTVTLILQSSC